MDNSPTTRRPVAPVGYRHPPAEARFRKGQSGNPAGRPKGSRNKPRSERERIRSLLLEEAYRPIKVNENGTEITMPMAQAVIRSLTVAAVKGDARAQAMFLKAVSASEEEEAAMEEMLGQAHQAETRPEKVVIETRIIDTANGRPTGIVYPYGDGPEAEGGKTSTR